MKQAQNERTANFGYLKKIKIKESLGFRVFEKLESKNHRFMLFQKPQRAIGLHERTGKELVEL